MSAEILRQAATLLLQRAEATQATPEQRAEGWWTESGFTEAVEGTYLGGVPGVREDGAYIQTMHPRVGLAVGEWLNATAVRLEERGVTARWSEPERLALVTARQILDEVTL